MPIYGDPELVIKSPSANDTLAPNFSVFGTCSAIGPNSNPTISVGLYNGPSLVMQATASLNNTAGTWEAVFTNAPAIPNGQASIQVSCSGMNGTQTVSPLTVSGDTLASITSPVGQSFSSWSDANGDGTLSDTSDTVEVYLTQAGYQISNLNPTSRSIGNGWQSHLLNLLPPDPPTGNDFVMHTVVKDSNSTVLQRGASKFFSVS
jgi:hypothetical protein